MLRRASSDVLGTAVCAYNVPGRTAAATGLTEPSVDNHKLAVVVEVMQKNTGAIESSGLTERLVGNPTGAGVQSRVERHVGDNGR